RGRGAGQSVPRPNDPSGRCPATGEVMTNRLWWLFVIDFISISVVRKIISGSPFYSVISFSEYLLIHALGLFIFLAAAATAVLQFRKFWLRDDPAFGNRWTQEEALFSILMTVLVASIFVLIVGGATPTDELDDTDPLPTGAEALAEPFA